MMKQTAALIGVLALTIPLAVSCKMPTKATTSTTQADENLDGPFPDIGSIMLRDGTRVGANSIVAFRNGYEGVGRVKSFGQKREDYYRYHFTIVKPDKKIISIPIEYVESFSDGTGPLRKGVFVRTRKKNSPLYMIWGKTKSAALVSEVVFSIPASMIDHYFYATWDNTAPVGQAKESRFDALENFRLTTLNEYPATKTTEACRIVQLDFYEVNDHTYKIDENQQGKEIIRVFPKKDGARIRTRSVCLQVFQGKKPKDEIMIPEPARGPLEIWPKDQSNMFRSKTPYSFLPLESLVPVNAEQLVIQQEADEKALKLMRQYQED